MKKILIFSVLIFNLFLFNFVSAESIKNNDVRLELFKNGLIKVDEHIVWSFDGGVEKHGIIRDIPLNRVIGSPKRMTLSNFKVVDETGVSYSAVDKAEASTPVLRMFGDFVSYKIGDADILVSGDKTYNISYLIENGIGYFRDYTEIYWNMIGTEWAVQTQNASANIVLPDGLDLKTVKIYCGEFGQKIDCATYDIEQNFDGKKNINIKIKPEYLPLPAKYGLTVAVAFSRGFLTTEPSMQEILLTQGLDILIYVFNKLIYIIPIFIIWFFNRKRLARRRLWKKVLSQNPIIAQYDAGGFSPIQADVIYNEQNDKKNISAEITFLMAEGYLDAKKDEDNKLVFTRLEKSDELLLSFQKVLLEALSDKNETEINDGMYKTMVKVVNGAIKDLVYKNLFTKSAGRKLKAGVFFGTDSKISYTPMFVSLFFSINPGIFIWLILGWQIGYIWSVSCILFGVVGVFDKNKYRLAYTEDGYKAKLYMTGLYEYIKVAEKDKIVFDSNPEKTLEIAEKLLPYAMVFGMEKKWIKYLNDILDMSGLSKINNEIYNRHIAIINHISTTSVLADHFSSSAVSSYFSSISRSSGGSSGSSGGFSSGSSGGSSGGGGGGGGGSSW